MSTQTLGNVLNDSLLNTNQTCTENGAKSYLNTNNNLVNLFYKVKRDSIESDIIELVENASLGDSKLVLLKIIAYIRDCRGGKGERSCGRILLKWLGNNYPDLLSKNLDLFISEYGRYDDVFHIFGSNKECNDELYKYVINRLQKDYEILHNKDKNNTDTISLLAKWFPSENKSLDYKYKYNKHIAQLSNISQKTLRKKYLSPLRKHINIVETKMCSNDWENIDYSKLPSCAMNLYKNAFKKHSPEKYEQFLLKLQTNETTINASVLYPYQIIENYLKDTTTSMDSLYEAQWKEMENKLNILNNALVLCDTSGSMEGMPLNIATSLSILISSKMNDSYKDLVLTFEAKPQLYKIKGETLRQKIKSLTNAPWGMNTDFIAALKLILEYGKTNNIIAKNMPKRLIVISDMQFDEAERLNSWENISKEDNTYTTNYKMIEQLYSESEYEVPHIIFWNVGEHQDVQVEDSDKKNVTMISGFSPDILNSILTSDEPITPYSSMMSVLNQKRYDALSI